MRRAGGLTLVEMVVALAILSLLAVACLHVTTRMARAQRAAESRQNDSVWDASLQDVVAADLLQASHVRLTRDGFELRTVSHLEAGSMAMEHLPTTVAWEVRRTEDQPPLLVRTQRVEGSGDAAARTGRSDMACSGVGSIAITVSGAGGKLTTTWKTMPEAATVQVERTSGGPVSFTVRKR